MNRLARAVDQLLVWFILFQMIALTAVVIFAVVARITGNSVSWYDEIAAIQLSWLTYYGGATRLCTVGILGLILFVENIHANAGYAVIFAESVVIGFFLLLAYTGYQVLVVLEGEYLVSLTWIPVQFTQSVIPIGASLFVLCEALSFPNYFEKCCAGISLEHAEIEEEVETELAKAGAKS